jgi:hypothetical protein
MCVCASLIVLISSRPIAAASQPSHHNALYIDSRPPLAASIPLLPNLRLTSLEVRVKGCAGTLVGAKGGLLAGVLRVVKGKPGHAVSMTKLGAPRGIELQVISEAGSWLAGKSCTFHLPKALPAEKAGSFNFGTCAPCLKCLNSIGFSCGTRGGNKKFRARVRAAAGGANGLYAASEWFDEGLFAPVCETKPANCPSPG